MSTTPRTDIQAGWAIPNLYGLSTSRELLADCNGIFVHAIFARTLETELTAMQARAEKAEAELARANDIIKRASVQFFSDGTDGEVATKMLNVLYNVTAKETSK